MCDKDSCSMTPPCSPLALQLEDFMEPSPPKISRNALTEDGQVTYLTCGGEVVGLCRSCLHDNSVIRKGSLQRLMNVDCPLSDSDVIVRDICGYQFVVQLALQDDMCKLFCLVKSLISSIQLGLDGLQGEGPGHMRKQVRQFFDYIKEYILHYLPTDASRRESFLTFLVSELHGLLLYTGRLTDVLQFTPNTAPIFGNKVDSGHHQFHLQLDVYWSLLDIFNIIYTQHTGIGVRRQLCVTVSGDAMLDLGYLHQLIQLVIWDLVAAAVVKFRKVSVCSDYLKMSPFTCTCVVDVWVLLIHLASHRNKVLGEESFWVRLYQVIQEICEDRDQESDILQEYDSDVFVNPPGSKPQNPVGFSVWLILHVAHLFQVDETGNIRSLEPLHSNYFVIKNVLQKKLSSPSLTEIELRNYLHCCLTLARLWEPETSLIVILWDYFYRKLNNSFQVSSTSLEGFAQISKSAQSLLQQCKKWCSEVESSEKDNSFHLFLRLVATQITRLLKSGSVQEWRQMKGRFCSKFHQRRMQELSETGLYNFTCLFLTLTNITEQDDMGKKLCDFYNMLDPSNISLNRRVTIWMGGLALSRIYVEKSTDITFVAEKLSASFNSVCREFSDCDIDPQRRHALWKMVTLYMEGLQDVYEASSTLTSSESKLLGEDLSLVFRVCRDGELRFIVNTLQTIISKYRSIVKSAHVNNGHITNRARDDHHQCISSYLWLYIFPFVKDHVTTLTPPLSLADLAAHFCLMAKEMASTMIPSREDFSSVFQHFSSKDSVQVSLSCHFLCQVLCEDGILDHLISTNEQAQKHLLQAWFRCVILLPPSSTQLCTLTSIIIGLDEIKQVFEQSNTEIQTDMEAIPKLFLQALGKLYNDTQDLREKMLLRDRVMGYFSHVPHHVSLILKNMGPEETMMSMYTSVGNLIKYCAPMLFAQARTDCPLPNIVNSMIVPHFLFKTDKPVHPLFLSAVRSSLHLFVQGLGKLDYKRAPYIARRLGDIVNLYLTRFPLKSTGSNVTHVHPLVSSLCGSYVQSPSQEALELRHLVLQMVHNNFLQIKNLTVPQSASIGLAYVTEVLQRTKGGDVIARDSKLLLSTVLEYMLLGNQQATKQHAANICKHLLEACVLNSTATPLSELYPILQKFVSTYLKLQGAGVFQILEKLVTLVPSLVTDLIPHVTSAVREIERKRGVGVDKTLRKMYISVLEQLDDPGKEEILRMKTEDSA